MSVKYIQEYQEDLNRVREDGGTRNESSLRLAFQICLRKYCKQYDRTLVPELPYSPRAIPDGTVKDALRLSWGYWEAKDSQDNLDKEIEKKTKRGYPTSNIIYEDTNSAVLIQNGDEVMRVDMRDDRELDKLVREFFDYEPPPVADFRRAIDQFKQDLPNVVEALRAMIDEAYRTNPGFKEASKAFLDVCRNVINNTVDEADVREMLIQHILTKDIFLKVFGEDQFHKENNIAVELEKLEKTFFTGKTRRETVDRLKSYYSAITQTAAGIEGHKEKQGFLKGVYEAFYKAYNPEAADRLGVVYTPNEIVKFMIDATNDLLREHFNRHIYDNNVQILDPATGTGTFITDLIEFIPKAHLKHKYLKEIHANELAILPYYIANINIEYTYKQRAGEYCEFPNICFVDTLDNVDFAGGPRKRQQPLLGGLSDENFDRIKRQNREKISVIIGNPPYNANQRNANDNNPNRAYQSIDERIRETYVKHSGAQKTKQYDMYKRFIRWASDRLNDKGILAFITNRAYLDAAQDDGFRKVVPDEFSEIYIVDLGGDVRSAPGAQNVFGIMTGVAIGFFVRKGDARPCNIFYKKLDDFLPAQDKLAYLSGADFSEIDFQHIIPDERHRWLKQTDNNFSELICLANRITKNAKPADQRNECAVFKLFSMAVSTNRDDWVYDFDKGNLRKKVKFFAKTYNSFLGDEQQSTNTVIKWSDSLQKAFTRNQRIEVNNNLFQTSLYRPFTKKFYFANFLMSDRLTENHCTMFGKTLTRENTVICFNAKGKKFYTLGAKCLVDLHFCGDTQCLPLYRYNEDGQRRNNITDWGLRTFRDRYGKEITAEDIFYYTYSVFHDPAYLRLL